MSIYNFTIIKNGSSNLLSGSQISGQTAKQIKINIVPQGVVIPNMTIRIKGSLQEFPPDFTNPNDNWSYVSFVENDSATLISGSTGLNIRTLKPISIVLSGGNYYWFTAEIYSYSSGTVNVITTTLQ